MSRMRQAGAYTLALLLQLSLLWLVRTWHESLVKDASAQFLFAKILKSENCDVEIEGLRMNSFEPSNGRMMRLVTSGP